MSKRDNAGKNLPKNVPLSARRGSSFVRVELPDDVGGGFITLRADPDTDVAELKQQALKKVKAKRLSQAYSGVPENVKATLKIQNSRLNLIMPKRRAPRIERLVRTLNVETKRRKDKNFKLTFYPGKIGVSWMGDTVTKVSEGSQASSAGVCRGWRVLAVNGVAMSANSGAIAAAIAKTNKQAMNTTITFAPGQMRVGTAVILHGLKTNATLNGYEAIITGLKQGNKYDVTLTNTETKTGIRGIHGTYLQLKQQEQYWRVVYPRGVKMKGSTERRADVTGVLYYGEIVLGLQLGDWIKHSKGYSRISIPGTGKKFLQQDDYCRFGITWPVGIIRKRIYLRISKDYENRRVNLDSIMEVATARQQELEEQDAKKKASYTPKQWKKFWQRQNPQFAVYYKHLYHENKKIIKEHANMKEKKEKLFTLDENKSVVDPPLSPKPILPNIYGKPFEEEQDLEDLFPCDAEFDQMNVKNVSTVQLDIGIPDMVDFMSM